MTESTEDRILDAAEELFAERGFAATTTRLLAQRADVNEVTIFRTFGNKLGVLVALFTRLGADALRREAESGAMGGDARSALEAVAKREIDTSSRHGAVAMRIAFEARFVPEIGELMGEGPARNLEALAGQFARWQDAGQIRRDLDPRLLAEAFTSLTSSYVMLRQVMGVDASGDVTQDEAARQLIEIFFSGAAAEEIAG